MSSLRCSLSPSDSVILCLGSVSPKLDTEGTTPTMKSDSTNGSTGSVGHGGATITATVTIAAEGSPIAQGRMRPQPPRDAARTAAGAVTTPTQTAMTPPTTAPMRAVMATTPGRSPTPVPAWISALTIVAKTAWATPPATPRAARASIHRPTCDTVEEASEVMVIVVSETHTHPPPSRESGRPSLARPHGSPHHRQAP